MGSTGTGMVHDFSTRDITVPVCTGQRVGTGMKGYQYGGERRAIGGYGNEKNTKASALNTSHTH